MKQLLVISFKSVLILTLLSLITACGGSSGTNTTSTKPIPDEIQDPNKPVTFKIEGTSAIMVGVIDASTITAVKNLLANNPEVIKIIMKNVPGSIDDDSNLIASRLVRESGQLTTHVPADGIVASGGTDFFLAGINRTAKVGAKFGVHSWADGTGVLPNNLPRTDSRHKIYLDYYREMGIPEDFYWFTLQAAPADGIHNMTEVELNQYNILTEALEY